MPLQLTLCALFPPNNTPLKCSHLGLYEKKRPKISCNPFIYHSFEQKLFDDKKFAFIAVLIAPLKSKENSYLRWFCKDCKRYFIGHHRLTSNYTLS